MIDWYFALKVVITGISIVFGVLAFLALVTHLLGKFFIKKQREAQKIKFQEKRIKEKVIKSAISTYLKKSGCNIPDEELKIEVMK